MNDDLQIQVNETGVPTETGADIRLSGQNITDAYNQIETNLNNAVSAQLNTIGANATAKGAMLTPTAPTQGISSYDYNRWVAPNLNATIAGLREAGAIAAGMQTLNNMLADAQANYNNAVSAARARATAAAAEGGGGNAQPSDVITSVTSEGVDVPLPDDATDIVYGPDGNIVRYRNPGGDWVDVTQQTVQQTTSDLLNQANPQYWLNQAINADNPQDKLQAQINLQNMMKR